MRRMSNGTRWALFFILIITFGLIALKILESLSAKKRLESNVYPSSHNYKLNTRRNEISRILSDTKVKPKPIKITKSTVVIVTKPPKPVIKMNKLYWKKRGYIFYREINPTKAPKLHVLLLHGREFTSANWVSLKTMDILAAHGYRVVAMDLPNHGQTKYKFNDSEDKNRAKVLGNFIHKVGLPSPVIVSASESGRYSLPYIAALRKSKAVSGFVSIAVEGTDRILGKDFKHFPPTLILRCSKDTSLGLTSSNALKLNVPDTTVKIIEGKGHACYINKAREFHELLLNFLDNITKKAT